MIASLVADAVRLLLRGRPAGLLVVVGALCGLFVRATRDVGVERLRGALLPGAALETLLSGLFLAMVAWGIVAGLVVAHDDRASGFFTHLAVRAVPRRSYVSGRLLGLVAATGLAFLPLGGTAALVSGLGARDVPTLRERVRPERVEIGGEPLDTLGFGHVGAEAAGKFVFPAGTRPEATLRLHPKIPLGSAFSGRIWLRVTYLPDGGAARTWEPEPFRPLRELEIEFDDAPTGGFALVVEPRDEGFVLEVDRDALTTFGEPAPLAGELAKAGLLVPLAGFIAAALSFFFGVGLSAGPASLAAAFVMLVAMGRDAVLDVVGGIGARGPDGEDASAGLRWLRSTLTHLVRTVPDLARFNPAASIGEGEALRFVDLGVAFAVAAATVVVVGGLTMACVPFRER